MYCSAHSVPDKECSSKLTHRKPCGVSSLFILEGKKMAFLYKTFTWSISKISSIHFLLVFSCLFAYTNDFQDPINFYQLICRKQNVCFFFLLPRFILTFTTGWCVGEQTNGKKQLFEVVTAMEESYELYPNRVCG